MIIKENPTLKPLETLLRWWLPQIGTVVKGKKEQICWRSTLVCCQLNFLSIRKDFFAEQLLSKVAVVVPEVVLVQYLQVILVFSKSNQICTTKLTNNSTVPISLLDMASLSSTKAIASLSHHTATIYVSHRRLLVSLIVRPVTFSCAHLW